MIKVHYLQYNNYNRKSRFKVCLNHQQIILILIIRRQNYQDHRLIRIVKRNFVVDIYSNFNNHFFDIYIIIDFHHAIKVANHLLLFIRYLRIYYHDKRRIAKGSPGTPINTIDKGLYHIIITCHQICYIHQELVEEVT